MNIETTIDELELTYKGSSFVFTDLVIVAEVSTYLGDLISHVDDPSENYERLYEIDIDSIEWYEDEERPPFNESIMIALVKHNRTVEEAVATQYEKEL